jgi:hypothetical protein
VLDGAPRAAHLAAKQRDQTLPTKGPKPPIKGLCFICLLPKLLIIFAGNIFNTFPENKDEMIVEMTWFWKRIIYLSQSFLNNHEST